MWCKRCTIIVVTLYSFTVFEHSDAQNPLDFLRTYYGETGVINWFDRSALGCVDHSWRHRTGCMATTDFWSKCRRHFGISINTQQWAQPFTAGVHGVSSKKCRLEVVDKLGPRPVCLRSSNHVLLLAKGNTCKVLYTSVRVARVVKERSGLEWRVCLEVLWKKTLHNEANRRRAIRPLCPSNKKKQVKKTD